ncbi:MAG: cysteine--tRNA ligase [Candidatus Puniceispirillaceae bacterium]
MSLYLYNTLNREKQAFVPLQAGKVGIYACGPTVYDNIHVGNARPLVVFDVLVRILRHLYPEVTYVRNITDVDDKINQRAADRQIAIDALCAETIERFHEDAAALHVDEPDIEPRATHHIAEMIAMIETLIAKGFAYEAEGHVLFAINEMPHYGQLSKRSLDMMRAGARVEIAPYKKDAGDFILWKPSDADLPGWDSPWGRGRPGWHIECSAMTAAYLGSEFDIHAGGLDLIFPHHENEIAQSCCAHDTQNMAHYWVHNGYVTIDGEKMSKSLGNFTTVRDALDNHRGEAVRYALLNAHYRAPLDYSDAAVKEAKQALDRLYRAAGDAQADAEIPQDFLNALYDDLNTPLALSILHALAKSANQGDEDAKAQLRSAARLMGLLQQPSDSWFKATSGDAQSLDDAAIEEAIAKRNDARAARDFATADAIRDRLADEGIILLDSADGTSWQRQS